MNVESKHILKAPVVQDCYTNGHHAKCSSDFILHSRSFEDFNMPSGAPQTDRSAQAGYASSDNTCCRLVLLCYTAHVCSAFVLASVET